jgi:mannose-6-phosphate isomerase-like protein (cupin superfamily)
MEAFSVRELLGSLATDRRDFSEFFRSPTESLSLTILRRPAGTPDDQQPHTEDEVYYVIGGRGSLTVAGETIAIGPGSVVFVAAGVEHHFSETLEDLEVLVFWSPARHSRRVSAARPAAG